MENKKSKVVKFNFFDWFKKSWSQNSLFSTGMALLVMIILQTIALGFQFDSFGAWFATWANNWINILRNNAGVGIIALGMAFVIISGGIDLAVGSTLVAIGAVLMIIIDCSPNALLASAGSSGIPLYIIAIIVALALGCAFGQLTGVLITKGKLPPFIATLGMMKILRSVTQHFMQTNSPKVPTDFLQIASFKVGGLLIMPIIYWIIIAILLYIISKKTSFGRYVYAIGSNERAAKLSGINVGKVKRKVYALLGMLVGFTAVLQVSRIGSMDYANAGSGYEMDAIAAVIVGGISMSGGKGSIIGAVLGMLIIAVMNNLLNLLGVPPFLREACKGIIVIGAVLLQKKEKN